MYGFKNHFLCSYSLFLNIAAYGFISSTGESLTWKRVSHLLLRTMQYQINAVLNLVIYITRISRMKLYHYKLFICNFDENFLKEQCLLGQVWYWISMIRGSNSNKEKWSFAAKLPTGTSCFKLNLIGWTFFYLMFLCVCIW